MLLFGIQIIPNNIKITAGARGGLRLFLVLYHRKLLSYDIKTLRYGCDRCADELCKLKLARIGAQRVASDSLLYELSEVKLVCIALQRIACVSLFWQEILLRSGAKTASSTV